MKFTKLLLLLPLIGLLAGCNTGDVVASIPGLSGVLDSALWSVLGPVVTLVAAAIWKALPRALIVPFDGALGAGIAALVAVAEDIPNKGWPMVIGLVVAVAMRGVIKFLGDVRAMVMAWYNGAPVPKASDAKVYVSRGNMVPGASAVPAVAANGKTAEVTGFAPWAK